LPAAVLGPVLRFALARLAAICFSLAMRPTLLRGRRDPGAPHSRKMHGRSLPKKTKCLRIRRQIGFVLQNLALNYATIACYQYNVS
jgi:hypothetical protein